MAKTKKTGLIAPDGKEILRIVGSGGGGAADEQSIQGYLEKVVDVDALCIPIAWQILVQPLNIPEKVGSIMIPEAAIRKAEYLRTIGKVWRIGPLAFKDERKYGENPVCPIKPGDWILMDQYAGAEHVVNRQKFRLITEDEVRAIAPKPEAFRFYF